MSSFVKHAPCEACGSRDNLGVWDDGHKFCFGCGYFEASNTLGLPDLQARLQLQSKEEKKESNNASVILPCDNCSTLPKIALDWLNKYGLAQKEKSQFSWSHSYESLIYSVFDPFGNLCMYQTRYFGNSPDRVRFLTWGLPETVYHILGVNNNCITVVEDIISAIKVGRHTSAMPLFGSNLSQTRIVRLANMFPNLNIWLDKDKQSYSIMARQRSAPFFNRARSIISELDPKQYNDMSIIEFLAG